MDLHILGFIPKILFLQNACFQICLCVSDFQSIYMWYKFCEKIIFVRTALQKAYKRKVILHKQQMSRLSSDLNFYIIKLLITENQIYPALSIKIISFLYLLSVDRKKTVTLIARKHSQTNYKPIVRCFQSCYLYFNILK